MPKKTIQKTLAVVVRRTKPTEQNKLLVQTRLTIEQYLALHKIIDETGESEASWLRRAVGFTLKYERYDLDKMHRRIVKLEKKANTQNDG